MGPNKQLADRLDALPTLGLSELRMEWRRLYRTDAPRVSRDIIMRTIAYRLQEIALGGLSKATQRRLGGLADGSERDEPSVVPVHERPKSGSRLVREWHGRTYTILVTDDCFEFEGRSYRSLTKIAYEITGAKWSGPRFFGLTRPSGSAVTGEPKRVGQETLEAADGKIG